MDATENKNSIAKSNEDDAVTNHRQTRRTLIKAGMLAIPVVMTVGSRPVLACKKGGGGGDGGYDGHYFADGDYHQNWDHDHWKCKKGDGSYNPEHVEFCETDHEHTSNCNKLHDHSDDCNHHHSGSYSGGHKDGCSRMHDPSDGSKCFTKFVYHHPDCDRQHFGSICNKNHNGSDSNENPHKVGCNKIHSRKYPNGNSCERG